MVNQIAFISFLRDIADVVGPQMEKFNVFMRRALYINVIISFRSPTKPNMVGYLIFQVVYFGGLIGMILLLFETGGIQLLGSTTTISNYHLQCSAIGNLWR